MRWIKHITIKTFYHTTGSCQQLFKPQHIVYGPAIANTVLLSRVGFCVKHTRYVSYKAGVICSVALIALYSNAKGYCQSPAPPPSPHRVIINFVVPIDSNSINQLLRIVNAQILTGTTKITILISSPGGDSTAAFAGYNILRNMPAEITTFNVGNVDSAAMLLFCAGRHRFSLPGPGPRFLIHGNVANIGIPMTSQLMNDQLAQLNNLNEMVSQAIVSVAPSKRTEIDKAIRSQLILSPEQAMEWGIVQETRKDFMEPGAVLIAVDSSNQSSPSITVDPSSFSSITKVSTDLSVIRY